MKPMILIGTEDIEFYLLLDHVLKAEGFRSMLATRVEEIQASSLTHAPQVVLLDCSPQSFSCTKIFNGLRQRRETKAVPVIALVHPGAEADHVRLLQSGVDEALTRPVRPSKIVERVRTIVAAEGASAEPRNSALEYFGVEMDLTTHRVRQNGKEVHLGPIEYKLLQHFLRTPEQVFSREDLINAAWPENVYVKLRTVDIHVGRLRKALRTVSEQGALIRTVRSTGYALTGPMGSNGPNP